MKIALLSAFYPYRGGIAQFGAMLYRALEEDHEVKAYTFKRQYPKILFPGASQLVSEDDKADAIPAERILDTIQPLSFAKSAKRILEDAPDLIISQYWMTFFGPAFGGVHKKIGNKAKRITILHNVIPHEKRFFDARANRYFLKHNDAFVVLSDKVRDDLLSLKPDAKFLRIDHPVYNQFGPKLERESALKTLQLDPSKKYLLFFGFVREYKGLDLLLEALNQLPEDIHLIVAGEVYGTFDKYQSIIDQHKLAPRVHLFTNYISDEEVTTYFSASDVCILPYKGATQSGITAVAHHFDMPLIATDVGGLKENIQHGVTGLIVDQPKSEQIAAAISTYFESNSKEAMSAAIAVQKTENNWENFAQKIVEFAKSLDSK